MVGLLPHIIALAQVVVIDVVLAGDNAIIVAVAASRVAAAKRAQVILWGTAGAVVLRILLASVTMQLLAIVGLTLAGGILLLWVCWKFYREVQQIHALEAAVAGHNRRTTDHPEMGMSFWRALMTIIVADLSMSLDNVLAVAGAAKGNLPILVVGLALSVLLMAVAANYIARLLGRYAWITWIGLAVIFYVAVEMIWRGAHEVGRARDHPITNVRGGTIEGETRRAQDLCADWLYLASAGRSWPRS
jgi:YjbE family integral membrane protein